MGELGKDNIQEYGKGLEVMCCTLYLPGQYPAGALCPVEVMFNPKYEDNKRQIWLWCHTLSLKRVWAALCEAFNGESKFFNTFCVVSTLLK